MGLLSFQWDDPVIYTPWITAVVMGVTAALMVSRLPTPSIKYMKLQRQHRLLAVVCFTALAALLIAWPWATMTIGLLIYVASIPFAIYAHQPRYATKQVP